MKRITIILLAVCSIISVHAQKYVNIHMNDGSFNGFYTSSDVQIQHSEEFQISSILVNGAIHDIPLANIDKIVIEDTRVSNNFVGDYRIYEMNQPQEFFKKIIVDNRASLLASRNGDFGANDTIFFASDYRNEKFVFHTDSLGRLKKCFTGDRLFTYLHSEDNLNDIVEFATDGSVITHRKNSNIVKRLKSNESQSTATSVIEFFGNIVDTDYTDPVDVLGTVKTLVQNYTDIGNNPELHNQFLIIDGLIVAKDFGGVISSGAALVESEGMTWLLFLESLHSFYDSVNGLMDAMFPDSEQMRIYTEYYQNKYGINLRAITPTDITSTSANIRGTFTASNGINGNLSFSLKKLAGGGNVEYIIPSIQQSNSQTAILSAYKENLLPNSTYFYYIKYDFVVDGLELHIYSDPIDFKTLTPTANTFEATNITDRSARIKCMFENAPNNSRCGIQYGTNGSYEVTLGSTSEEAQYITLSGLQPNTTYSYRAFIQYEGDNYYGETRNFTTSPSIIYGTWTCVWHDTPPNAQLMSMTLNNNGIMTQTYYYHHNGSTKSYSFSYEYNGDSLIFYKDNGDTQYWNVTSLNDNSLVITASNGFSYYFQR